MTEPSPDTAPTHWSYTAPATFTLSPEEVRAFVRTSLGADASTVHAEWDPTNPDTEALSLAHLEDVRQAIANELGAPARITQLATGPAYLWDTPDGGRIWVDPTTIATAAPVDKDPTARPASAAPGAPTASADPAHLLGAPAQGLSGSDDSTFPPPFPFAAPTPRAAAEPHTAHDRDRLVSVTVSGGRLIDARVDPRTPRERLGPAIVDAVNAALAAQSAAGNQLMADARAILTDAESLVAAGSAYADQILRQAATASRELESQLDEAYQHRRGARDE